jgi:hypothetical protein
MCAARLAGEREKKHKRGKLEDRDTFCRRLIVNLVDLGQTGRIHSG